MRSVRSGLFLAFLVYVALDLLTPFVPGIFHPDPEQSREAVLPKRVGTVSSAAALTPAPGVPCSILKGYDPTIAAPRKAVAGARPERHPIELPRRHCAHEPDRPAEDSPPLTSA